jgi:hypothetical protein
LALGVADLLAGILGVLFILMEVKDDNLTWYCTVQSSDALDEIPPQHHPDILDAENYQCACWTS